MKKPENYLIIDVEIEPNISYDINTDWIELPPRTTKKAKPTKSIRNWLWLNSGFIILFAIIAMAVMYHIKPVW